MNGPFSARTLRRTLAIYGWPWKAGAGYRSLGAGALDLRRNAFLNEAPMRTALAVLIFSIAGSFVADDKAAAQSWCAISNQGAANCGFASIDKCREEVAGNGGSCIPEAPVGHRQPTRRGLSTGQVEFVDPTLDALQRRVNKRDNSLILCRGC